MTRPFVGEFSMCRPLLLAAVAVTVWASPGAISAARAQSQAEALVQTLVEGTPAEVAGAREQLSGLVNGSDAGRRAEVARLLVAATRSERVLTRLNAMLVTGDLASAGLPASLTLATGSAQSASGFRDPSPGVRYWAARAVSQYLANAQPQDGKPLLNALMQAASAEPSAPVAREMVRAMAGIDVAQTADQITATLNARVALHADPAQPQPLSPARLGLQLVQDRLIQRLGSGEKVPDALGELGVAAARMMRVAVEDLQGGAIEAGSELSNDHASLLKDADQRLRFVYDVRNTATANPLPQPPDPGTAIEAGDWAKLARTVTTWETVLQAPPFNVPADRFAPPTPAPQESDAAE